MNVSFGVRVKFTQHTISCFKAQDSVAFVHGVGQRPYPALSFPSPRKIPRTHRAMTLLPFPSIDPLSTSMDSPLLDTSRGQNRATCGPWRRASLAEPGHGLALPSFLWPDAVPLRVCMSVCLSVHPLASFRVVAAV